MLLFFFFFFNDTATTEIYTLSLHDALPISEVRVFGARVEQAGFGRGRDRLGRRRGAGRGRDRESTRLNSSHPVISYAVFCLKKKKTKAANACMCHMERMLVLRMMFGRVSAR